jgi:hypothetical protein
MAHGWAPLFAKLIGRQWRQRPKEHDDEVNEYGVRSARRLANRSGSHERRFSSNVSMFVVCAALMRTAAVFARNIGVCLYVAGLHFDGQFK